MPRGRKSLVRERIRALLRTDGSRYVDIGAQVRVFRCTCGKSHVTWPKDQPHPPDEFHAAPAELASERIWGGRYDTVLRQYVGPPEKVIELPCHEGQVQLLTLRGDDAYGRPLDARGILRILALGSPGAGKTLAAVTRALLMALDRPNTTGGLVAPIGDSRAILWEGFEEICPPEWIKSSQPSKKQIILVNNTRIQILAAKASSKQTGSPLKGRSWDWTVVDESQSVEDSAHNQIATRGRRAGARYRIFETATNDSVPAFRIRLEQFKTNSLYRRINFTGFQNPWVDPEYWHTMQGEMSERDFREIVLAQDLPPERLTYDRFNYSEHITPVGKHPKWLSDDERRQWGRLRDITSALIEQRFGRTGCSRILAQDFGVLVNATIALKAFETESRQRLWWATDEITTNNGSTEYHSYALKKRYDPDDCVVIADPHFNSKEADKSDYNIFQEQGWYIQPAIHGKISVKHRIAMFNSLLEDASGISADQVVGKPRPRGQRHFFIDCDSTGRERCKYLVRSLVTSEKDEQGLPEKDRKNGMQDPSHWPSAAQFGVYWWERTRGVNRVEVVTPDKTSKRTSGNRWFETDDERLLND